jgi:LPXTG-motif cell wall-anchored protein
MEYKFTQHVTKEDYIAFLMNHLKMNIMRPFNMVLFIFGLGYLLLSPIITGTNNYAFTLIGLSLIFMMGVSVIFARRNAAKRYDKNQDMFDMTYLADEEGFSYLIGDEKVEKKWYDFYSASETEDYLYVFTSKDSGSVIVKREVPNEAIDFIREKLKKHVNAKRLKLM